MGPRQGGDPPLDRRLVGADGVAARQLDDGLRHRQGVLGAMVDFAHQEKLAIFAFLFFGHVGVGAEPSKDPPFAVADRQRPRQKPAADAVAAAQRKQILRRLAGAERLGDLLSGAEHGPDGGLFASPSLASPRGSSRCSRTTADCTRISSRRDASSMRAAGLNSPSPRNPPAGGRGRFRLRVPLGPSHRPHVAFTRS